MEARELEGSEQLQSQFPTGFAETPPTPPHLRSPDETNRQGASSKADVWEVFVISSFPMVFSDCKAVANTGGLCL